MRDVEFVGKMNPQPFTSLKKEEEMRIQEIKEQIRKEQLKKIFRSSTKAQDELTYDRDVQEDT